MRTNPAKYTVFLLAADRGLRLSSVTKSRSPKFLLEISPNDPNPLKRTIAGRIIHQAQESGCVEKATILYSTFFVRNWREWEDKNKPYINLDLSLISDHTYSGWPGRFYQIADNIKRKSRAIIIPADKAVKNIDFSSIIYSAERFEKDDTPFLHATFYFSRQLKHWLTTFTTNYAGLMFAYYGQLNPDNLIRSISKLLPLILDRRFSIDLGSEFVDVNTEKELLRARAFLKKWSGQDI